MMDQRISRSELKIIEQYADALFKEHGIDVEFQNLYKGTHFFDRINDPRNESPITVSELKSLFKKISLKYGDRLGMESPGAEGVLKDMQSNINIPFILKWDDRNRELDLIPKTIMKKKNFVAKDRPYVVESLKMTDIFTTILNEIGDNLQVPPSAKYMVHESGGRVAFEMLGDTYEVTIKILVRQDNIIAVRIDFDILGGTNHSMTNKHSVLKLMGYIVATLEQWFIKFKQKYKIDVLKIAYIMYDPKSESDDTTGDYINRRDRLYRSYIEKFAKKYDSSTSFSTSGGIRATFDPKLEL